MPGQGVIVGVGSIDYPAEFQGADEHALGSLGVSKVVTITSTYDHRIIQGAESGMFLKRVHELLMGEHDFYERDLPEPRRAVRGRQVATPTSTRSTAKTRCCTSRCRSPRSSACTACAATSSPTSIRCGGASRELPQRARPGHLRPHDLGPRPRVPHRWRRRRRPHDARRPARRAARRVLPHHRRRVHAHPEHRRAALDPGASSRACTSTSPRSEKHRILERLNAAEAFEKFLATKYVGTKRFGLEGAESRDPDPRRDPVARGRRRPRRRGDRHGPPRPPQRARQRDGQELRPDLQGVRGSRRPVVGAGLRRREVPPRRDGQVRVDRRARASASSSPPTRATSRPSTRS